MNSIAQPFAIDQAPPPDANVVSFEVAKAAIADEPIIYRCRSSVRHRAASFRLNGWYRQVASQFPAARSECRLMLAMLPRHLPQGAVNSLVEEMQIVPGWSARSTT
jgi:hypothetical protein